MKNFVSRVKSFSQKAAELKAAIQQLPPKIVEAREAVTATTGQLHELKSQIQYSVSGLTKDDATGLSEALQEINASADIFEKAGYVLSRVDVELSPMQRLVVHLARVEEMSASTIRSLADHNKNRKTTHSILSSLLQAQQMANTVELDHMTYSELIVSVGPVPSVRLCWHADEEVEHEHGHGHHHAQAIPQPPPLPSSPATATAPQSYFAQSSFFEKRPEQRPAPATYTTSEVPSPGVAQQHSAPVTEPAQPHHDEHVAPAAKEDPLARFKKMPNLTKR
jgi:hypothetical protein